MRTARPTSPARSPSGGRRALMRDRFTRVLKGHIAVARAVFPEGTNGAQIDALARAALWRAGLDFDHGTGHGIGSYLRSTKVRSGSPRPERPRSLAGMIISNEPGYYAAGAFGIRIENLVVGRGAGDRRRRTADAGFRDADPRPDRPQPVEPKLMDADEIAWLDDYHARVRKSLVAAGRLLDPRLAREGHAAPRRGQGAARLTPALGRRRIDIATVCACASRARTGHRAHVLTDLIMTCGVESASRLEALS